MVQDVFNSEASPALYNGSRPFVLVDIGTQIPNRGDSNGFKGIAQRVADKIGAELLVIDKTTLEEMYPQKVKFGTARMLKELFGDKGEPDFVFSLMDYYRYSGVLKNDKTVYIDKLNEFLAAELKVPDTTWTIVPHHLSPDILAFEGHRFAQEYEDLPRPFIGINLGDLACDSPNKIANRISKLCAAYDTASFFVCSSHKTSEDDYDTFIVTLKDALKNTEGKFPIIDFNYRFHTQHHGLSETWNPYIGLLDQADHMIMAGLSRSMISERLTTGKTLYTTQPAYYSEEIEKGYIKNLFDHQAGLPLTSEPITPIDLTGACADAVIALHQKKHDRLKNQV